MTNADRIRSMSDEELAVFLGVTKSFCDRDGDSSDYFTEQFKEWLKKDPEEDSLIQRILSVIKKEVDDDNGK